MSESEDIISYRNGRSDMKDRVIEKIKEELAYLKYLPDSEQLIKFTEHLINKVQNLI